MSEEEKRDLKIMAGIIICLLAVGMVAYNEGKIDGWKEARIYYEPVCPNGIEGDACVSLDEFTLVINKNETGVEMRAMQRTLVNPIKLNKIDFFYDGE
jgi:hypothetical protein